MAKPKQKEGTYDPSDIPDDLKDRPIYHALGKVAYQEHYSKSALGNFLAGYVVFGEVRGTSFTENRLYLEQIAGKYRPKVITAIQKAEHSEKPITFLNANKGFMDLDMVKLLEVILK
jgi:hypothetical protein